MNRALLTFSFLIVAAFAAAPRARAEHDEHEHEHHEEHKKPLKKHPPTSKPKSKPKSAAPAKPGAQAKQTPAAASHPAPGAASAPIPPVRGLPKPQPITDPKHFVRHWAPPPSPKTGASGAAITATPVAQVPTAQHTAVFNNTTVVTTIISNQQNEVSPNRYYWHHDGGYNYVHYYSGGAHWYGFYVGPNYYWSQYHANRWWWYDPIAQRYLYFNGGYWWWQDPFAPSALYVYQSGSYVPYAVAAAAAAPAAPPVAVPKPAPPARVYHSDVDAPNYTMDPNGNRFALVVGVENYKGLPKAAFAERDAAAVRAHLAALGYPDQNVAVLTGTQAARGGVARYVESWLPARVTDQSRVFVYFAGYGALDPTTGVAYLLPRDGDVRNLPSTGYALKQLYAALNALPAKEIVVVLDAGFSGRGGRSVRAGGAPPAGANIDVGRGFAGRIVAFSAAGTDEIAGTLPDQGHGLFTYNFLKGLNGAAPQTQDGLTVQSLFDYLTPNVEDAAVRDHRAQTPQLLVPPDGQRKLLIKDLR